MLTVLNAVVGLRQEGKAESAMNALKSMMKATARVRRDGAEAEIPAEELVVGDVVLLSAGDQVPGRRPDRRRQRAADRRVGADRREHAGGQGRRRRCRTASSAPATRPNMAFMNTPVTHGSGVVIVTGTGADTELGKISGMLAATAREQSPLTKRARHRLTLWIAAAAGLTMIVMFVLGRSRGEAWDALFVSAISLAIAAIPEALPTVTQVILSLGGVDLAKRNAIVKDLPSVETLGFTSAINSDKTGTLTMNQMTAVEVVDPTDRYTISGHRLRPRGPGPPRRRRRRRRSRTRSCPTSWPATPSWSTARSSATRPRAPCSCSATRPGWTSTAPASELPRLATLPFDPTYKLMATFNSATDAAGGRSCGASSRARRRR